jgi:hypothetical protein
MDAIQKHPERITNPEALADRLGQSIFRLETHFEPYWAQTNGYASQGSDASDAIRFRKAEGNEG